MSSNNNKPLLLLLYIRLSEHKEKIEESINLLERMDIR